jgi:hypothetical protein
VAADMRKTIQRFGDNGAHLVRAEWSAAIAELVVEWGEGQQAEMFRRTSRVIEGWEAELIPEYLAQQASMEEVVSGSGLEFEQRVQGVETPGAAQTNETAEEAAGYGPGVFRASGGRWTPRNQRTRPETTLVSTPT